jgi:hypothetical protein
MVADGVSPRPLFFLVVARARGRWLAAEEEGAQRPSKRSRNGLNGCNGRNGLNGLNGRNGLNGVCFAACTTIDGCSRYTTRLTILCELVQQVSRDDVVHKDLVS